MSRSGLFALVVPALLVAVQMRVSESDGYRGARSTEPPLWNPAGDPDRHTFKNCPLIVSTNPRSAYVLTAVDGGVEFDIDGDGRLDRVAWIESADVAFLAIDQDGDGRITSGRELIGDHTVAGAANGPNALVKLSANGPASGTIDASNPIFTKILLWRDSNRNGQSEPEELRPADEELTAIGLGFSRHRRSDRHGNHSRFRGFVQVRTARGTNVPVSAEDDRYRSRHMYDACLVSE